jgi:hypothetical protein
MAPQPPKEADNASTWREWMLRDRQIKSIRGLAAGVVADMVSRRAQIPATISADVIRQMPPPEDGAPPITPVVPAETIKDPGAPPADNETCKPAPGDSGCGLQEWLHKLRYRESTDNYAHPGNNKPPTLPGFIGAYQFGESALQDVHCYYADGTDALDWRGSWTGTCGGESGINTKDDFLGIPTRDHTPSGGADDLAARAKRAQDKATITYARQNWATVSHSPKLCQIVLAVGGTQLRLTPSGLLAAAHLVGPGGADCLAGGHCGANVVKDSQGIPIDGNSTRATEYVALMNGFPLTEITGRQTPCGPGENNNFSNPGIAKTEGAHNPIRDVAAARMRANALEKYMNGDATSYQEVMQIMTKERFFDPAYYTTMADNIGAMRQEQTAVDAYTTIQLQDINKIQEQINALLAARASLKMQRNPQPDLVTSQPLRPPSSPSTEPVTQPR